MKKIESVALLGAGAVGSYFIWGLSEKMGKNFCVVASGDRKERLERDGIWINGKNYRPNVKTPAEAKGPDLLFVSCKYNGLERALDDIRMIVEEHTMVLSLLNGVDSEEKIGQAIGMEHMLYSLMRIASMRDENGITFPPERTEGLYFGERENGELTERAQAILDLMEGTGIRSTFVEDIMTDMWVKYASNVAQNLPQAILGVGYGAYIDSEHVFFVADKLWKEVAAVARTKGIILDEKLTLFKKVKEDARFSTLQDLDAKRHTEIEMFAGEMIRMGKEAGIEVPYCEYTYHMIKALEEKHDGKFEY